MLNNFSKKSPPYHVTQYDVSTPLQRLEVEKITGHQSVRGRGGHRGDVRDALDGSLWTVLGAENEPPAFLPRDIALRGGHSELAPPDKLPVPPDANWCSTTGTFSEQRRAIPGAR